VPKNRPGEGPVSFQTRHLFPKTRHLLPKTRRFMIFSGHENQFFLAGKSDGQAAKKV
jgi:hypothetical protein